MKYVVVGAGIAGVSCASEMLKLDRSAELEVVIISASSFVKSVENYRKVGQYGEKFDVKEIDHSELFPDKRFTFLNDKVISWDHQNKELTLQSGAKIKYDKLCIATGSRPRFQDELGDNPRFLFLRDTQSAIQLKNTLENSKHILIVGNGGIATELIYELNGVKVTWMVRDEWICASFFPEDVEKFIERRLLEGRIHGKKHEGIVKHLMHTTSSGGEELAQGAALGPDWCATVDFESKNKESERSVDILRNCVINRCVKNSEGLEIEYTDRNDGKSKSLNPAPDTAIWASGVIPNAECWTEWEKTLRIGENGGILVNDACESSLADVFSCGDVCSISLPEPSLIWNQRQLWTQARQQGEVCGRSMVAGAEEARMQNMYFEIFSHCTTFFGLKIVLLGDYKPEKHPVGSWKIVLRNTEEDKLIRCVVADNVIVGALLIGETDMEETLENLILNKTDLEGISETFLEPNVDLDDYFD